MNIDASLRDVPVRPSSRVRFVPILEAYVALCGEDGIPLFDDALASDIASFLSDAHVIEFETPARAIYRLSGSEADARMGGEFAGYNLADLMDEQLANLFFAIARACFDQPCGVVYRYLTAQKNGRIVSTESLSLPVQSVMSGNPFFLVFHAVENYAASARATNEVRVAIDSADPLPIDFGSGIPEIFNDLDTLFAE